MFAYIANGARKITVTSLSLATGTLTKLQEVETYQGDVPEGVRAGRFTAMALSPDRRFLYASNRTAPYSIHTFAIDGATGLLTHIGEAPTVESTPFIATDRSGRFLLGAHNPPDRNRRTGFISVAPISDQGIVLAPSQVLRTPPKTHSILTDPSNRFAIAPACDADVLTRCTFDVATGTLSPDGLSPIYMRPQTGPRHHRYHPNNRFVYVGNEYDGAIYCYSFDARNGAMAEIQEANCRPPQMAKDANVRVSDMRLTPDGKWLYVGVRGLPSLAVFSVDGTTGRLTPAGHYEVPKEPRGFNIDPFGHYLLDSGFHANCVVSYKIDPRTGGLTKTAEFAVESPNWIKIVRLP